MFSQQPRRAVQLHDFDDMVDVHDGMHAEEEASLIANKCANLTGNALSECKDRAMETIQFCNENTSQLDFCFKMMQTLVPGMASLAEGLFPDMSGDKRIVEVERLIEQCAPCTFSDAFDDDADQGKARYEYCSQRIFGLPKNKTCMSLLQQMAQQEEAPLTTA